MEFEKLTKEEKDRLKEMFGPYECKAGEGASLFDDWKEWASDFSDQCTMLDRKYRKRADASRMSRIM